MFDLLNVENRKVFLNTRLWSALYLTYFLGGGGGVGYFKLKVSMQLQYGTTKSST
jgi:hypothetical protein